MRLSRVTPILALSCILSAAFASAEQVQLVSETFFPAELEFKEIKTVKSDKLWKEPAELAAVEHAPILLEAGLKRHAEREYALSGSGSLLIKVATLTDARGAYSILSLLSRAGVQKGPPGDFFASEKDGLLFAAGNHVVLIRTTATSDFSQRVALSVANRIGRREAKPPALVNHLPRENCDPSSIRYFLGPRAFAAFGQPMAGHSLSVPADVEVSQIRCEVAGQDGMLTLLGFATIVLAEEYFGTGAVFDSLPSGGQRIYTRQTGTLVGILKGNFDPEAADKVLGSIEFSYSIKWIYDRSNRQGRTIWGVPVRILGTVVRSLVFTVFLCLISIAAGAILATGRVYFRNRFGRSDSSELIRLKIDED